jgi:hypothetical protein
VAPRDAGKISASSSTTLEMVSCWAAAAMLRLALMTQSRNLSTGAAEARAPAPSRFNGKTWQASRRKNLSALA